MSCQSTECVTSATPSHYTDTGQIGCYTHILISCLGTECVTGPTPSQTQSRPVVIPEARQKPPRQKPP